MSHQGQYEFSWGSMGLAWHLETVNRVEITNHNGATGGYYAYIGFNKQLGIGVVVLVNCQYNNAVNATGPSILKILINQGSQ